MMLVTQCVVSSGAGKLLHQLTATRPDRGAPGACGVVHDFEHLRAERPIGHGEIGEGLQGEGLDEAAAVVEDSPSKHGHSDLRAAFVGACQVRGAGASARRASGLRVCPDVGQAREQVMP